MLLYSVTLANIFKVKSYKSVHLRNEVWRKNACYDFYGGRHSPPNGISANVVHGDLDLNFQDQTFDTLASRKR